MQKSTLITFPTFTFLPELAGQVRNTIEWLFLAKGATFDSFAFVVAIIVVLLIFIVKWSLTVVVVLIRVVVAIALNRR